MSRDNLGPAHGIEPWNEHAKDATTGRWSWVAWERREDHPTVKPGYVSLSFVHRTTSPWRSWTNNPDDGCRFPTKADALAWVRVRRARGITTGACRIGDARVMAAEANAANARHKASLRAGTLSESAGTPATSEGRDG